MTQIGGGQNRLKPHSHFTYSHTLPKIAISLALLLGGANIALAEESGVFVGAEIGYGAGKFETKVTLPTGSDRLKYDGGGVKYGVVVGYKQFFTPYLGLRYYANVSIMHGNLENDAYAGTYWKQKVDGTLVNYGANVDFLANFVANETLDFGAFLGLGIGGNTWISDDLDDFEDREVAQVAGAFNQTWKLTRTGFDLSLNVGLRANIAKHHGVELVAKVPFLETTLLDKKIPNMGSVKNTLHQPFSVTARYTFSF